MRKLSLGALIALLCLCVCGLFSVPFSASAETNSDGWEQRDDGYFYEVNPPITDIMEFHGTSESGFETNTDWYLLNYTGYLEGSGNNPFYVTAAQGGARKAFNAENNSVKSYYQEDGSTDSSDKQILVAQYDWGYNRAAASGGTVGTIREAYRHLDFTFALDFTDLTKGWFSYYNEGTIIEFNLTNNTISFKQHSRPVTGKGTVNGVANTYYARYGAYGVHKSTVEETINLTDKGIDLKSLTGMHVVTILIEERVAEGQTAEDIKGCEAGGCQGAIATVKLDDTAITHTYATLNYYSGLCAFANYTNADLDFYSTKSSITFNANGGSEVTSEYYATGDTVTELPTPTYGAYTFGGWFNDDETFENEFTAGSVIAGSMTLYAKWIAPESPNTEGWEISAKDGYFYEKNPYLIDLFEYHEDQSTGEQTNADFYVVNYTGYLDNNTLKTVSRKMFSPENNSVQSYFTNTMGENAAKEILVIQYDWSVNHFKQGSCWNPENTNALQRNMDFTFNLDFTDLNDGWFTYVNDSTKITFQVKDNQIIFEQKPGPNKLNYSGSNLYTQFVNLSDYGLNLKELTGNHKISLLIEDRVLASTAEITHDGNHGARATVKIDDVEISYLFEKMGYYAGIIGIANYTNAPLTFSTTHNFGEWTEEVPATCETDGTCGYYTCSDCGKHFGKDYKVINSLTIDALGHDYQEVAEVPATCETDGTAAHYTCSRCDKLFTKDGDVYTEVTAESLVLASPGHAYGEWIEEIPATCVVNGTLGHYHCSVCEKNFDAEYAEIDDLTLTTDHTYGEWIEEVPATCTENGTLGHYHCSVCEKDFDDEYEELEDLTIAATHTYGEWIEEVPATETETGTLGHYTCSECGKYFDAEGNEIEDLTIAKLKPEGQSSGKAKGCLAEVNTESVAIMMLFAVAACVILIVKIRRQTKN